MWMQLQGMHHPLLKVKIKILKNQWLFVALSLHTCICTVSLIFSAFDDMASLNF